MSCLCNVSRYLIWSRFSPFIWIDNREIINIAFLFKKEYKNMEQLDPIGLKIHNKKTRVVSFDKFKNGEIVNRPKAPNGYQPFGTNPAEYARSRQMGYKQPVVLRQGSQRIGGAPSVNSNMKPQIEELELVSYFEPEK